MLAEPDLGTAITIMLMRRRRCCSSPARRRARSPPGSGSPASLGLLAVWFEPYRRERLLSFIDPWHDAQGAGYQNVQAMIGLGSGGIFGRGLGQGIEKITTCPRRTPT